MTNLNTQVEKLRNTVEGKLTSPFRPPSCDRLKLKLKECPFCESENTSMRQGFSQCLNCGAYGPDYDTECHEWNSIPRRSEVAELLRLVDGALTKTDYNTSDWGKYNEHAAKLRKELKL